MGRSKTPEDIELKHKLTTRVNDHQYRELCYFLQQNPQNDMSTLLRTILADRPVKIFTRDRSLDDIMEELTRLRTEIRSIGVNINQITHRFNAVPEIQRKAFFGQMAFREYAALQPKIERLLDIIAQLAKKWLFE